MHSRSSGTRGRREKMDWSGTRAEKEGHEKQKRFVQTQGCKIKNVKERERPSELHIGREVSYVHGVIKN